MGYGEHSFGLSLTAVCVPALLDSLQGENCFVAAALFLCLGNNYGHHQQPRQI